MLELLWRELLARVVHDAIGSHQSAIEPAESLVHALKDLQESRVIGLWARRLGQCSGMTPDPATVRPVNDPGPERFKWAMLHVAVGDPPWNTGMAWADATEAFPDRGRAEVDGIVRDALLDLLDSGYVFFYRFTDFDDEFAPRTSEDGLAREEVAAVLSAGRLPAAQWHSLSPGREPTEGKEIAIADPLAFRATEAGERRHAELGEDDYRIGRHAS